MWIMVKGGFEVQEEGTIEKVLKRLNDELKKTGLSGEINELGNPNNRRFLE